MFDLGRPEGCRGRERATNNVRGGCGEVLKLRTRRQRAWRRADGGHMRLTSAVVSASQPRSCSSTSAACATAGSTGTAHAESRRDGHAPMSCAAAGASSSAGVCGRRGMWMQRLGRDVENATNMRP
eukprot:362546-Chlamydomonas_euryale.AAC.1